jgi:steroid 5-alpha reductase family enzyme
MLPPSLVLPIEVAAAAASLCWVLSVLTREYSWVDRLWSVMPPVYAWLFAWQSGFDARATLMAALATAWGARLTFNYARKGGYWKGGEDYRWAELRAKMPPWAFQLFNLGFIAGYQHALIFLFTLPAWAVAERKGAPLGAVDAVLALAFFAALAGETIADQQQWAFHGEKKARAARGEAEPHGFCTTGLFRFSRHPNFFFELSQWWLFALFPVAAGASLLGPGSIGVVLLTLLFHGSANFTESISARKYPAYAGYQRTTSRIVPMPPKR